VAHFVVIVNDVMNDNMAAFAHVGARLGAFFYWTRCLENNVPFDNIAFLRRIRKMSTLSSANVTDVNLVLKERTHMRLCINMLIFLHNLGNWPIVVVIFGI